MAWTITNDTPSRRIFTRSLNPLELSFFYDGKLNGVADLVENYLVVTSDGSLFHPENVSRAWVAVKQIFPLLGATTKDTDSETPSALFVVSELDLNTARPYDTTHSVARSEEQVHSFVDQLISGPRQLSDELLARLYIYSRIDKPGHFHALFHHSHFIIDGTSALTMIRTFFDVLSLPPCLVVPDLQTRLALCVGTHSLNPNKCLPNAQIRWRQAAGQIIHQSRRQKLRGGTTLPRVITTYTRFKTPLSRKATITFSREQSSLVVASCRKHSITVGSVLPVLGQMGSTRVLHRRYLRGEVNEEQWWWYRTQPFHAVGPINSRPFLDQEWHDSGGAEVVMLGIDFYSTTIPSLPTVPSRWLSEHRSELEDGAPPFSALLPQDRLVRRAQAVKKQLKDVLAHPLLFEIGTSYHIERALACKAAVEKWRKLRAGEKLEEIEEPMLDFLADDYLHHNGGASLGNIDPLRPTKYPLGLGNLLSSRKYYTGSEDALPETPTTLTIEVVKSWKKLSVRAAELYLGAETKDQELSIFVSWDGNVFKDELVEEWLEEIKKATEYYLC
ncbi:hypothetical protein BDM02DRAFT_3110474 [Thelephora ganbajun]|uniref:Uncharacterized protein n=1 Tax=Thelephora ganbajun TaxID=370292 RepID=A0ACB6ZPB3_THEGA|nr:hypothetical protein BDM02DRAFT_3110474 [Thelephora ganbajun]